MHTTLSRLLYWNKANRHPWRSGSWWKHCGISALMWKLSDSMKKREINKKQLTRCPCYLPWIITHEADLLQGRKLLAGELTALLGSSNRIWQLESFVLYFQTQIGLNFSFAWSQEERSGHQRYAALITVRLMTWDDLHRCRDWLLQLKADT